ncbi:MAG: hypothetical protein BGO95_08390 [Micrococcales bacterium 73-13]|nr:MAG: hypothetical protein BGO95_08390 [Micrococcales bacterium 73-13]
MRRQITTWALVAATALGLAGCAGAPSTVGQPVGSAPAASAPAPAQAQSVAEACVAPSAALSAAGQELADAGAAISQSGVDPQSIMSAFDSAVEALKSAAATVTNQQVKDAFAAIAGDYDTLRGLLGRVIVDRDLSALGEFGTAASSIQASAQELVALCAG